MLIDATQKPKDVNRDLDLPLRWELTSVETEALRRRITAERNRSAQERMMGLMRPGGR